VDIQITMAKKGFKVFAWVITSLVAVGAINWGIKGGAALAGKEFDLVTWAFQWMPMLGNIVFLLVGFAGLAIIPTVLAMILKKR
jgi:uncharacterized membrane protein YuzA (DUF378 family)